MPYIPRMPYISYKDMGVADTIALPCPYPRVYASLGVIAQLYMSCAFARGNNYFAVLALSAVYPAR